jgi:RNA polymerase sigma-70 factor, ECF subfamily
MDNESADWLNTLKAEDPARDDAMNRLHSLLVRVAHAEARRRSGTLPSQTIADLDDLCMQAANDALAAITRKLDDFKGLSRFTTWATKFVILEISSRLRCNAWRTRRIEFSDAAWENLQDSNRSIERELQDKEQFRLVRQAVAKHLSERQRAIVGAAILEEVPIDVLAERLGSCSFGTLV